MTMRPAYIKEIVRPINGQVGDLLKVSDFIKYDMVDGTMKNGSSAFEKRGVEAFHPEWTSENCISVTSVLMFVLTLVSVHLFSMKKK